MQLVMTRPLSPCSKQHCIHVDNTEVSKILSKQYCMHVDNMEISRFLSPCWSLTVAASSTSYNWSGSWNSCKPVRKLKLGKVREHDYHLAVAVTSHPALSLIAKLCKIMVSPVEATASWSITVKLSSHTNHCKKLLGLTQSCANSKDLQML